MIDCYNVTGLGKLDPPSLEIVSTNLVVQKNSVLLFQCSKEYCLDEMNLIREQLQKVFPNNKVIVLYNDIIPQIIHDNSYKVERPLAEEPYGTYYT